MNAIETEGLTKQFGSFTAVDHITFSVKQGEIFGFLGANGAGKTTAMRMLCGLLKPSSGSGKVAGFDVYKQSEQIKKNIGYMSQRFSLYEDLTAYENLQLFGGIYGMTDKDIKTRSEIVISNLGLSKEKSLLVSSLPLGIKQKVSFAVSTFHSPKIVFLDEPTGGVDPLARRMFWEMIYEVSDRGITVFVTTHYMDEAEYCNRLSIMVDGQIKAMDTPHNLKKEFNVASMDEVFHALARQAKRSDI